MEALFLYILKVNVALTLLYVLYKLIFTKDTFFDLKRFILISICVTSVLYPFIPIDFSGASQDLSVLSAVYNVFLPEVTVDNAAGNSSAQGFSLLNLCILIYLFGVILISARTFLELRKVYKNIANGQKQQINGINTYVSQEMVEPYSFMKWICINTNMYDREELEEILLHEHTHAKQYHSIDVLLVQAILILNWFNPFVWLLRKEIKMNHEYLADRTVISSGYNKKSYQYHLIGFIDKHHVTSVLYNSFSVLPLKSRLKMLNRKSTPRFMMFKYLLLLPAFVFLLVFANCQSNELNTEIEPQSTTYEPVNAATVFEVVEKMPLYPGGHSTLMEYLSKNIKYPREAQANGIQGRVIVQFIVDKEGNIIAPEITRSVDERLDEEAIRVISSMLKWIPGEQRGQPVNVRYTVPVNFRLQ